MRNIVKTIIYFCLNALNKKNGAVILMYHSISDSDNFFCVKSEEFARQMEYLRDNNYKVVSLRDLLSDESLPQKTVVLTFDDGYEDNFLAAFPILKKFNFPATIFLATGLVGKINNGIKMLDWEEIKEMNGSGLITFEPHTVSHFKLTKISKEQVKDEINNSKIEIEKNLQRQSRFFAYPSGKYNEETINAVKDAGFEAALTVEKGTVSAESDRFILSRNSIDSKVNFTQFKGIVKYGRI